jgi:hypothetical protein
MGFNYLGFMGRGFSLIGGFGFIVFLLLVWTFIWKGLALWKAARKGNKIWFVVLLVLNTLGLLEILYLYIFSERSLKVSNENIEDLDDSNKESNI